MNKYLKYSITSFILIFAALSALAIFTDSISVIKEANWLFVALASLFFIISIILWIIPWAFLIKTGRKFSVSSLLIMGFSCVYGALTPIQIGAEALRSIKAKEFFGVSYSESISAAMVVKGIKFFFLGVLSSIVLAWILVEVELDAVFLFGLISGFLVIFLASLLFLLPLNKKIGFKISSFFGLIGKRIKFFKVLEKYFKKYSIYLKEVPTKTFVLVLILAGLSFFAEFFALWFCFSALNLEIALFPFLFLFVIISILERTPILPRGIGLVEAAGFILLSIPEFTSLSLSVAQIGAILILFDVVRLLIPTLISLIVSFIKLKPVK